VDASDNSVLAALTRELAMSGWHSEIPDSTVSTIQVLVTKKLTSFVPVDQNYTRKPSKSCGRCPSLAVRLRASSSGSTRRITTKCDPIRISPPNGCLTYVHPQSTMLPFNAECHSVSIAQNRSLRRGCSSNLLHYRHHRSSGISILPPRSFPGQRR